MKPAMLSRGSWESSRGSGKRSMVWGRGQGLSLEQAVALALNEAM